MKKLLNTVYVTTEGSALRKDGENLVAEVEGEVKARVPLHMLASVVTTFAGLIADPVQLWTGIHKRRVMRLLARLDRAESGPALAREHVLARLGDLSDTALSLWRSFRG